MSQVDVRALFENGVQLSPAEHEDDRQARLVRERMDFLHRRWIKTISIGLFLLILILKVSFSLFIIFFGEKIGFDNFARESAVVVVTSFVSGFLGFALGRM